MKTLFLLLIFFVFNYYTHAQGCLPEGITFTTQAQIDNFQTNYPGCTEIEGNVMIGVPNGISDITNLNGLSILTSIGGRLSIGDINTYMPLPDLISLSGLENLTSIGGSLVIYSYPLTNLSGLEGLTSIGDSLYLAHNEFLTSLTGLNNLNSVGGGVFIGHFGNPWWDNPALASLTGLENLTTIGDNLYISNTALTSMTGLGNLTSIGGDLFIGAEYGPCNTLLTSLTGLENLTSIGGGIVIADNDGLTSISGLNNIDPGSITDLFIQNNASLSICDIQSICDYLESPNGSISISENAPGCNSQSDVVAACVAGLEEAINSENHINIYPNPGNGTFTISSDNEISSVEIYNMQGQRIYSELQLNQQSSIEIDVSNCSKGIYFIRISEGTNNYTRKILVQ